MLDNVEIKMVEAKLRENCLEGHTFILGPSGKVYFCLIFCLFILFGIIAVEIWQLLFGYQSHFNFNVVYIWREA